MALRTWLPLLALIAVNFGICFCHAVILPLFETRAFSHGQPFSMSYQSTALHKVNATRHAKWYLLPDNIA
jgi:hypothetical protein